jgi:pantoate--beta-alanine ligase
MTADLDFGIEIVGVPTVREADGLAMSSRNRLLGPAERTAARCVPRALDAAAAAVARGEQPAAKVVAAATAVIATEPAARLEYAEARDPETLEVVEAVNVPTLLALAVWVGSVRLIDNRVLVPGRVDR